MDPISIGEVVWEYTGKPITRQFGYLISYGDNVKELKDEFKKLEADRESLQLLVEAARRKDEEILPNIQNWLDRADEIKKTVETFNIEESQAETKCSLRACPNLWSRYRLSKKAKKILTARVIKLTGEGNFNRISCPKPPVLKWIGVSSTSFSRGTDAFYSRISAINMIMDAIADPTINKIGLYGLGGVGKTTLAHDVVSRAQKEKFTVVMVNVTQNPDYKKIQNEIGDTVGLKLDEESELMRAGRLRQRLKQEKQLLVILDDLWNRIDLDKIGVSLPVVHRGDEMEIQLSGDYKADKIDLDNIGIEADDYKADKLDLDNIGVEISLTVEHEGDKTEIQSTDDHKRCKLLLISRDVEVLSNQMSCGKNMRLDVLSENEATELFNEMAGIKVDSDPDLLSIATHIATECAGLPVAIVTVARKLRNKSLSEWRNALLQLQNPSLRDVTGWRKVVYAPIKWSYDNLETKELKLMFLLSSKLYNDLSTLDLFKYCIGLGVFEDAYTMEDARGGLHMLISKLKASCLFLDSSSNDRFMMHDIVRDVGLYILSNENHVLSARYNKLDGWPKKNQLENYKWMCFLQCDLGKLPEKLSCPRLEFFHLENKDHEMIIPDSFFEDLHGLGVIELTRVNLPFLTNSITHLIDLRTLCLHYCMLGDISMIGELKNLRALSLVGSIIQQLPCELGKLMQLQLFDLTSCSKLKVIPPNVISKLKKLEEMYLESSFNQWQHGESKDDNGANANLSELVDLPNLSTLHIHIPHASMLRKDMFSDRLERYRILIGDVWEWSVKSEISRTLKLKLNASIRSEMFGVKKLMDRVEDLFLDEVNGIKSVL